MSRYKIAKYILIFLLVVFTALALLPYLYRQEKKLEQEVHCIKAICVEDGQTNTCSNIVPQVGHFVIVHEKDGSILNIKINGLKCN